MGLFTATAMSLLVTVTHAYPYFQGMIPNGDKVPNPCLADSAITQPWAGVGHRAAAGSGPRNPFGLDLAKNNFKWDECICKHDSDGDGRTNGEELGDPECIWTSGTEPSPATTISHPEITEASLRHGKCKSCCIHPAPAMNPHSPYDRCRRDWEIPLWICEPLEDEKCKSKNFWLDCDSMTPFECPAFEEPETESIDLTIEATSVPATETTYVCTAFTFPEEITSGDFHMIGAETIVGNEAILHHVIVYGCPDEFATNVTKRFGSTAECGDMLTEFCNEIIYIWAVGVDPDCFDPEYGVRLGREGFKTIAMEFHWNNPQELSGESDNSGVRFYYTPRLRQFDAQSIFFGRLYLELPPGQRKVVQRSTCPGECTTYMFPEPVFISQIIPHMHYLGRGMLVELIRDGEVIQTLVDVDNFDYNEPKAQRFKPHVMLMPGDEIRVECIFDTTDRDDYTYWGDATSDEMCIAITQYYPKTANATDCWGFEHEQGNIGSCDFTYGEELLYSCYGQMANEAAWIQFLTSLSEAYSQLSEFCDVTGRTCMDGCEAVIAKFRENPCYVEEVDGWTKNNLFPTLSWLYSTYFQISLEPKLFIQAFVSCDQRSDNDSDDDGVDTEDHQHTQDSDGLCVFEPPEPAAAPVPAVSMCLLMCSTLVLMLF